MERRTDYLVTILVMSKWSKVMIKLVSFQGCLINFFHKKADQIIYLQKLGIASIANLLS